MIQKLKFQNENFSLSVYGSSESPYFKAREVAILLGYKYTADATYHVPNEDKMNYKNLKEIYKTLPKMYPQTIFINKRGFQLLLLKSTLPNAKTIAKEMGIDIIGSKIIRKEADSLCEIMKAFNGEQMIRQYPVSEYRIDLYFSEYKIAVECDERGHKDRDSNEELQRYLAVTKKLNCQWYRYNPDAKDYDISKVINGIFKLIKSSITVNHS